MRLIVATENMSKMKEIRHLLKGIAMPIVSLNELPDRFHIVENGTTFAANAEKKALPPSRAYPDDLVLGEDSGLEVDALGGEPGVRSKRYAGNSGDQSKNNVKLLKKMEHIAPGRRCARFRCVLAVACAGRTIAFFEGTLSGKIATVERGNRGFGYDPVFFVPRFRKTVAELSLKNKNLISHRARAFKQLRSFLTQSPAYKGFLRSRARAKKTGYPGPHSV